MSGTTLIVDFKLISIISSLFFFCFTISWLQKVWVENLQKAGCVTTLYDIRMKKAIIVGIQIKLKKNTTMTFHYRCNLILIECVFVCVCVWKEGQST